jgi:predicted ArsR family transcriptional regulator
VVDDDQPTNRPPGHVDQPATDQPTTPALVTLEDAADALGITVNAVRQRIKRGTLIGIRTETGWLVDMVATDQESGTDRPTTRPTNQAASATDHRPTIDLAPLVSHIATLEDQVQRLTEASTLWQERARTLEQRLLQLPAGDVAPETAPELPGSSPANDRGTGRVWTWVKQAWRG